MNELLLLAIVFVVLTLMGVPLYCHRNQSGRCVSRVDGAGNGFRLYVVRGFVRVRPRDHRRHWIRNGPCHEARRL